MTETKSVRKQVHTINVTVRIYGGKKKKEAIKQINIMCISGEWLGR